MAESVPTEALQLHTTIRAEGDGDGELRLELASVDVPAPGDDEVTIRVEAAPINPSDLGLLLGPADVTAAKASGTKDRPVVTAPVPKRMLASVSARLGQALPVGNEGAGVVVAAGSSEAAQALLGKTVGFGGASYSQYRTVPASSVIPMGDDTTPREAASCTVNPLTVLAMLETMRMEGHTAIVHTAAASNLGQMLVKLCQADGVELVNIVRRPEQAALLEGLGAKYVCNSSDDDFEASLTEAIAVTGATLGFDATGGGRLAGQILGCMERAQSRNASEYSRYGSDVHKQVYLYGRLDLSPTTLGANLGFAWGIGGWLLPPVLGKIGKDVGKLYARVVAEIKTTFASEYTAEISLAQTLDLETLQAYQRKATGEKYLIAPQA